MKKWSMYQVYRDSKSFVCIWLVVLLTGLTVSLYACDADAGVSPPASAVPTVEPKGKEMPEVMKELSESEQVQWMAGIWVDVVNGNPVNPGTASSIESYYFEGEELEVVLTVQNGLDLEQPYYLVALADGVPTEFTIDHKRYWSYHIGLTSTMQTIRMSLQPEFSLNLGRLDFLLFYDGDPLSDYHMVTYTIHIAQNAQPALPEDLWEPSDLRSGLLNSFQDDTYGAWIWPGRQFPADDAHMAPREQTIPAGATFLFEAVSGQLGHYRTVLFGEKKWLAFTSDGKDYKYIDWYSRGNDMLQIPVDGLNETLSGAFFSVITPIESTSLGEPCKASCKNIINMKKE